MKVMWVKLDGQILDAGRYEVTPKTLTISNPPSTEFKAGHPLPVQYSLKTSISES